MLIVGGWAALQATPVDAIPDISENQTIVFTRWDGRSPQDVENQITNPLATKLRGVPNVKEVRGLSGFGFSQIYVVFEDNTPFYWARTRVLERLATARAGLPEGAEPELGPDATPLGQVFWYTVEGEGYDLATLRSLQDYTIKYALQAAPGVAEVASVGGYVRQYQIDVDPSRLAHHNVTVADVRRALAEANLDVGAKTLERGGMELVIRGLGFIKGVDDIKALTVKSTDGVPLRIEHVATVTPGPDFRRGALADERGEQVGGVVTMRFGENPRKVIEGVKKAIERLEPALPDGVRIVSFYDRTHLVDETMGTLRTALFEEMLITLVIILLFLLNARASLIVAVTLPIAVLAAFIAMRLMGIGSNIMSLAGIAIAIGTMVDMGIVVTENVMSRLLDQPNRDRADVVAEAAGEVAPAIMVAVATTVVSFLPVFFLTGQAERLFTPLAWTKTFALLSALAVAIGLVPVLCHLFLTDPASRGRWATRLRFPLTLGMTLLGAWLGSHLGEAGVFPELRPLWPALVVGTLTGLLTLRVLTEPLVPVERNPVSRAIQSVYQPTLNWILENKKTFAVIPLAILLAGGLRWGGAEGLFAPYHWAAKAAGGDLSRVEPFHSAEKALPPIGEAFMPPLDEGSLLFMPSLLHQASLNETLEAMVRLNKKIREVPEVSQVMGKLGRADTALDPAPVGMIETVVNLKPKDQWREGVTSEDIVAELRQKTRMIGLSPSWLQPIETRVVMLQSGLKASMALELIGSPLDGDGRPYSDLEAQRVMEAAALAIEPIVAKVEGATDVSALRLGGKPYIEVVVDEGKAGRHGISVRAALGALEAYVGGKNLTWSLEGRERYPIRIRYARELQGDLAAIMRLLVPAPHGGQVPLGELASIDEVVGPASIRTRDGELTAYVMFNAKGRDEQSVMNDARAAVEGWRAEQKAAGAPDPVPGGLRVEPAGRYLSKIEADERLLFLVPVVIFINLFLLYIAYRRIGLTLAIFAAIPITLAGGFIGLWLWPLITGTEVYLTTAVWVGFIALFGIAVDDGAVMATYLMQSFDRLKPKTVPEVRAAVLEAGLRRIRPCLMTTATTILALVPILLSDGRGSDVMQPMALPLVGGMVAELVTLFVLPALFSAMEERRVQYGL